MKINVKKTKTMIISRNTNKKVSIILDGQIVQQVEQFKYLGSTMTSDGKCLSDIRIRIALAKEAFNKRKELLKSKLNIELKKKIVKAMIWPVLLYGCETWTLKQEAITKLEAMEMWIWRQCYFY